MERFLHPNIREQRQKGVILKQGNSFQVKHISKRNNKIIHHISEPFGEKLRIGDHIKEILTGIIDMA